MKVLHILSGDLWGGAEAQMLLQIAALRELGVEAEALLFNDLETAERFRDRQIPVHICPENLSLRFQLQSLRLLGSAISPAIIVAHGYKEAIFAAVLRYQTGARLFCMIHGWVEGYTGFRQFKKYLYNALFRFIALHIGERVIVVSGALVEQLSVSPSRGRIIRNVAEPRSPESVSQFEVPTVLVVGRLVPVKRVDVAVRAFGALLAQGLAVEPQLGIVGDGPLLESFGALIGELNLAEKVQLIGFRRDAPLLISKCHCLLITSESEGIPTVMLEAMRAAVPIVSTDLPGIREIKELFVDYPIRLCEFGNIEQFRVAMKGMLEQRPEISPALLEQIDRTLSPRRAAEQHMLLYRG